MPVKPSDCNYVSFNHGAATHPCEHRDGKPCDPCNQLTEIEAQIDALRVRHLQALVKRNHVHSPLIHRFPPEIVTYIFTLAFPPPDRSNPGGKRTSPLILAMVCHTWRVLTLSTPTLWRDISVHVENPNFPLLNHQVAHSGMVPLSIHLFTLSDIPSLRYAKQAVSFVIKQLHRTASFWLTLPQEMFGVFDSVSVLDYPKAMPLLKEFRVQCTSPRYKSSFRLTLPIEPSPRYVLLDCHSCDQICLDWTNVSSFALDCFRVDGFLPVLRATKDLKHLILQISLVNLPTDQNLVVNRTIQDLTLRNYNSAQFMLTMTSLPSLRTLEINNALNGPTMGPIICDFLRRSQCPLQVLTTSCLSDGETAIQTLIDVLKHTNGLQHLTFRLSSFYKKFPPLSFEPFLRRLLLRDRDFLPCLQTLSLRTEFVPPIGLLLDVIAADHHTSEISTVRPLQKIILELDMRFEEIGTIPRDELQRILQLRAAGKTISIINGRNLSDLVEYWKSKTDDGDGAD